MDDATGASIALTAGSGRMAAAGTASQIVTMTVLLVAAFAPTHSAVLAVPGWVFGGGGTGKVTVSGAATISTAAAVPAGKTAYLLTLKTGAVTVDINGTSTLGPYAINPNALTSYNLGTNFGTTPSPTTTPRSAYGPASSSPPRRPPASPQPRNSTATDPGPRERPPPRPRRWGRFRRLRGGPGR